MGPIEGWTGVVLLVRERWVDNGGVRLHLLESNHHLTDRVPVLFLPGMLGTADSYLLEMTGLRDRRCIALTLRGCGQSDAPETGYSFEDYVSDIESVVDKSGFDYFCLMGFSASVPRVIEYAARHPEALAGLILGDYPAKYQAMTAEWVKRTLTSFPDLAKPHAVHALQRESREVILWDRLNRIECPVLVLKGGQPDSLLKPEAAEMYKRHLKKAEIVVLEESGHMLSKPDYNKYLDVLKSFFEKIDPQRC